MKYAIGVDIGGTSIKYSLVGEDGSIRKKEAIRIDKKITGEETISRLGRALNESAWAALARSIAPPAPATTPLTSTGTNYL